MRWVRSWFRGPVILDLFLSAYGTAIEDRRMFGPRSVPARLFRRLDRRACRAADLVLLDTPQHAQLVAELLAPDRADVDWVPISDPDEAGVGASPLPARAEGRPLELLFFGTGVPLHGLQTLIQAVATCRGDAMVDS